MATIMTAERNGKTCRCDDTCHQARTPHCRCICGGRYHGSGTTAVGKRDQDITDGLWAGFIDEEGILNLGQPPPPVIFSDPLPLLDGTIREDEMLGELPSSSRGEREGEGES